MSKKTKLPSKLKLLFNQVYCNNLQCRLNKKLACGRLVNVIPQELRLKYVEHIDKKYFECVYVGEKTHKYLTCIGYKPYDKMEEWINKFIKK